MGEVESTRRDHRWRLWVRNMAEIRFNLVISSDLLVASVKQKSGKWAVGTFSGPEKMVRH